MSEYNHAFHVAFEVICDTDDPTEIADEIILGALARRVAYLIEHPKEICQACEGYDVYKIQEDQILAGCGHMTTRKNLVTHEGCTFCPDCAVYYCR